MSTPNFHYGVSATLRFCYKIASLALVSIANQPIFLCNQDIHAHTMGCKRGYRCDLSPLLFMSDNKRQTNFIRHIRKDTSLMDKLSTVHWYNIIFFIRDINYFIYDVLEGFLNIVHTVPYWYHELHMRVKYLTHF